MTPLAAYYVMIQSEHERKNQTHVTVVVPSRLSLSARIAKALRSRPRPSRSSAAQPA